MYYIGLTIPLTLRHFEICLVSVCTVYRISIISTFQRFVMYGRIYSIFRWLKDMEVTVVHYI